MSQVAVLSNIRKLTLGAVAVLLFVLLLPSMAFAADGQEYTVKVDTGYLALRTAPSYDESNEVGSLYTGDRVTLKQKTNGDYWWVYAPKYDREGYVNKNYLKATPAPNPPSPSPDSYGDYRVKVDKNYLALRTAPAYDSSNEVGKLYTGDVVTVKNKSNEQYWWVYSPKYGREGYVNKDYLVTEAPYYGDYGVKVEKGYLALRTAPAYDSANEIGKLNNGDVVTLKEKRGQYWWVYSPKYNREGYVNSDYLVAR